MSSIERDQEITREFATFREHRMAQIDRLYDFDYEPDPKTVTATDPKTGEVLAHFTAGPEGVTTHDRVPVDASAQRLSGPGISEPATSQITAADFPDGMTMGDLSAFTVKAISLSVDSDSSVKAWSRDDGTITRIATVNL